MHSRTQLSASKRMHVFERDDFTCQYCGRSAPEVELEVDHVLPVARNGKNDISNLVTICRECNYGKGDDYSDAIERHIVRREIQESKDEFRFTVTFNDDEYRLLKKVCSYASKRSPESKTNVGDIVHDLIVGRLYELAKIADWMDGESDE